MKRTLLYIIILLAIVGCSDFDYFSTNRGKDDLQVVCRIPQFEDVDVATRGTKTSKESEVHNMLMFVCDENGLIIAKPQYEEGSKPIFGIDRSELNGSDEDKDDAQIVVLANVTSEVKEALISGNSQDGYISKKTNLSEINEVAFSGGTIDIPSTGIPMLGIKVLNLVSPNPGEVDPLAGSVIEVPLKCLYAKVVFNIAVIPNQKVDGHVQSFELKDWTVYNVPENVAIGAPTNEAETMFADGTMIDPVTRTRATKSIVNESTGGDKLSFSFYMPEHKINPKGHVTYPWGDDPDHLYDDYRQYLKPTLVKGEDEQHQPVEQKATYVQIAGRYTDHHGQTHDVTYDIYLGDNNYNNFHILRDHQYNNNITIKGIKNSSTAVGSWVTYDHRVNVVQKHFNFNLERETLLDCHWEIRPIRINFNDVEGVENGYKLRISLKDQGQNWLRMEYVDPTNNYLNNSAYCNVNNSSDLAYGKRRYFTTDLVTNTLKNNKQYEITYDSNDPNKEYTIWAYIDQFCNKELADSSYPNPSFRNTAITCELLDASGNPTGVSQDFVFQQYNVFKVQYGGNPYYIEYFEEYLYNFDSKEEYGHTTDGMAWGMLNTELSKSKSVVALSNVGGSGINTLKNKVKEGIQSLPLKYDFYMERDIVNNNLGNEGLEPRAARSGKEFTKEISKNSKSGIGVLATNETPQSAVEYALNKNKRKSDGTIDIDEIKWYLPAIDEIEEICKGGYNQFEVFQDKLYWSSQPAFKRSIFEFYDRGQKAYYLPYFKEDSGVDISGNITYGKGRARATKVDDNFNNVKSESYGIQHATQAVGTAPLLGSFNFPDGPRYFECNPEKDIDYTGSYSYWGTTHTFKLQFHWNVPSEAQLTYYRQNSAWKTPDDHNSYTITNGHDASYSATWKDWYYFYDEGNCSRDEIHRVRCVYKEN